MPADVNLHACMQVVDAGSLNGTMLNGRIISTSNRREGRAVRLSSDDILQLGSRTTLKVTCVPHQLAQVGSPPCMFTQHHVGCSFRISSPCVLSS